MTAQWFWTSSSPAETNDSPLTSQRTTIGSKNLQRSNSSGQNDVFSERVFNAEATKSNANTFLSTTCTRTLTRRSSRQRTFGLTSLTLSSFRCRRSRGTTTTKLNRKSPKRRRLKRENPLLKSHKNLKSRKRQLLGLNQSADLLNCRKKRPPNLKLRSEASLCQKLLLRQRRRPQPVQSQK